MLQLQINHAETITSHSQINSATIASPPPIAPNTFFALTFSAAPKNVAILAGALVKLATGTLLNAIVLVPAKKGAALVAAGMGTKPTLTACGA